MRELILATFQILDLECASLNVIFLTPPPCTLTTIVRMVVEDNDEEIDVTEVSGDFFLAPESDKLREARSVSGPNLQAVTEALFDNCEDYQNIQNKSSTLWRPY